mgnify:CR=1 FL=1
MVSRNRSKCGPLLAAGITAAILVAAPASAETLGDAFKAAYTRNPTLQAERANLRSTDENVPQARAGWLPTVTVNGDIGVQQITADRGNGAATEDLTPTNVNLAVVQPVWSGGRTFAAVDAAEALVRAGRETLRGTEQTLFVNVVTVYMNVLQAQAVVQLNINNEERLKRQLTAAQDRFRVGEITRTDVAQAEARVARAVSDRVQAEGNLIAAKADYVQIVGTDPSDLDPPPALPTTPTTEEQSMSTGLRSNPDLRAAKEAAIAAKHNIRQASGALLPTVQLEGTASHSTDGAVSGDSTEVLRLRGVVNVPLYQGGAVYSQVRQQRATHAQRRLQVIETERAVRETVTQAWEALTTARSRIKANREEVRANEIALDGVTQEAQVGSRTTLDVLDAEQELLDAQVSLVGAERDEYVATYQLLQAIGGLNVDAIGLKVQKYNPRKNYNRVRDKLFGTDGGLD